METFKVRYGESFDFTIETDDDTATQATFIVGNEGEMPVMEITAEFDTNGVAHIEVTPEDTKVPLGTYKYQITVELEGNKVHKYPTSEECGDNGLPEFVVLEALDEVEVS